MCHRRHLCEFTGLDFEMSLKDHYDEALLGEGRGGRETVLHYTPLRYSHDPTR